MVAEHEVMGEVKYAGTLFGLGLEMYRIWALFSLTERQMSQDRRVKHCDPNSSGPSYPDTF